MACWVPVALVGPWEPEALTVHRDGLLPSSMTMNSARHHPYIRTEYFVRPHDVSACSCDQNAELSSQANDRERRQETLKEPDEPNYRAPVVKPVHSLETIRHGAGRVVRFLFRRPWLISLDSHSRGQRPPLSIASRILLKLINMTRDGLLPP